MNKIGIIGAMEMETAGLLAEMKNARKVTVSGLTFTEGELAGREVVVTTCGVGKVFAAMAAEILAGRFGVTALLNTGVAGGLLPDMHAFDAVVAEKACQHDMNTTAIGDPQGLISGLNKVYFETDAALSEKLAAAVEAEGLKLYRGTVASGDLFVARESTKAGIRERFGAVACEMEGGAIAQVAAMNELPFAILRLLSDTGDGMEFSEFAPRAAEKSVAVTLRFLASL